LLDESHYPSPRASNVAILGGFVVLNIKELDIEFALDKSGSMAEKDCPGGKTRWDFARESVTALATYAQEHDPDGITVVPFATTHKVYEGVTADKVTQVFQENQPMGSTATHLMLKDRLDAHFARRAAGGTKSTCLLIMTDGAPDDQNAVAQVIIDATHKMDSDDDLAMNFIQVGNDQGAAAFLKYLDDNLVAKGAKFDIVDTVPMAELENLPMPALLEKTFAD
jgi:hypothetical protein